MKTKKDKQFDAVEISRNIKDDLDLKLSKMSNQEIVKFFKKQRERSNRIKPSA